jgi:chromosome segregation ATPase
MNKLVIGLLVASLAGLAWLGVTESSTRESLRAAQATIDALKTEQTGTRAAIDTEIARLREADAKAGEERQKAVMELRSEVGRVQNQAKGAEGRIDQTHAETLKNFENLSARLSASESTLKAQQAQVASEINGVRQTSTAAQASVTAVSNEVNAVKADSSATKQRLDQALAELRQTSGDLGKLSGLIATNSQEISLLKQLGDRNYLEFMVFKSKTGTKLGVISVKVTKTDVKAQRYSLELMVNDITIEKKDRNINEPLQFYMGKSLFELVVNRVGPDQLIGYLSSPKAILAPPPAAQ